MPRPIPGGKHTRITGKKTLCRVGCKDDGGGGIEFESLRGRRRCVCGTTGRTRIRGDRASDDAGWRGLCLRVMSRKRLRLSVDRIGGPNPNVEWRPKRTCSKLMHYERGFLLTNITMD